MKIILLIVVIFIVLLVFITFIICAIDDSKKSISDLNKAIKKKK